MRGNTIAGKNGIGTTSDNLFQRRSGLLHAWSWPAEKTVIEGYDERPPIRAKDVV